MFLKLIEVISTVTKLSSLTLHFEIDPDVCSSSIIYIAVGGFSLQCYGEKKYKVLGELQDKHSSDTEQETKQNLKEECRAKWT